MGSDVLTFDTDDCLNRKKFAEKLTQAIRIVYAVEDDAYVLSLNASFGSGKTTFVNMWKHDLENKKIQCMYLNAWEQNFNDEPLMPILETLLERLEELPGDSSIKNKIYTAFTAVSAVGASIAKTVVSENDGKAYGLAGWLRRANSRFQVIYRRLESWDSFLN